LGGRCAAYLEILGLMMHASSRSRPAEPKPQPEPKGKVKIPESWTLTPEQKEFIESFNQTENKKK
jgi:hypothetical protein